jgi:hypothetical protein
MGNIVMYSVCLGFLFGFAGFFFWVLSIQQVRQAVLKQVGFNILMMSITGTALTTTIMSAYSIRGLYHALKGDV